VVDLERACEEERCQARLEATLLRVTRLEPIALDSRDQAKAGSLVVDNILEALPFGNAAVGAAVVAVMDIPAV